MSVETERSTIEKFLADNWTTTPIQFDNVRFDKPADSKWIALSINTGSSEQITMGSNAPLNRHIIIINVQVFTEAGIGSKQAKEFARDIATLFRRRVFRVSATETILCREPQITRVGVEQDTGLYNMLVAITAWRDVYE